MCFYVVFWFFVFCGLSLGYFPFYGFCFKLHLIAIVVVILLVDFVDVLRLGVPDPHRVLSGGIIQHVVVGIDQVHLAGFGV